MDCLDIGKLRLVNLIFKEKRMPFARNSELIGVFDT